MPSLKVASPRSHALECRSCLYSRAPAYVWGRADCRAPLLWGGQPALGKEPLKPGMAVQRIEDFFHPDADDAPWIALVA